MTNKTWDDALNEYLQHEAIMPLHLTKSEAKVYAIVIEQMVKEHDACKAAPVNECPNGNHMHMVLFRDDNNKLHLTAEVCKKMARHEKVSSNYLTDTFGKREYDYKLNKETFGSDLRGKEKLMNVLNKWVKSGEIPHGLFVHGKTGVGKSFAMKAFCNEVANKMDMTVAFFLVPDLITQWKTSWNDKTISMKEYDDRLKNADILVLDDIGYAEKPAGFYNDIIFSALEYRLNNNKKTFFTSNYSLTELEAGYIKNNGVTPANRLIRRIKDLIGNDGEILIGKTTK